MSGLILGALGQGLAAFGNAYGSMAARDADREDRQEERRRELEERRAYEERRDALYRRTADQQAAGRTGGGSGSGSGSDGISIRSMAEGGEAEEIVAGRAGMTVPELRRLREYRKTGDMSPFGTKVKTLDDEYGEMEATAYPEGLQQEVRAKMQSLARIEESYALGGRYDDVTKGRRNQQVVDATDRAVRQPESAGIIAQGVAAGEGKPLVDIKDNTAFNQYTGANKTTPGGEAEIRKDDAQAGKYRAEAKKLGEEAKEALRTGNVEKLSTMLTALNKFSETGDLGDADRQMIKNISLQVAKAIGGDVTGRMGGKPESGLPGSAPYKVGEERPIAQGPHKGKTAVWDGKGWVLKGG